MYIYFYISECVPSYGENCLYPCSIHCINQVFDSFNGTCSFGCAKGENCDRGLLYIFIPYLYYIFVLNVDLQLESTPLDFGCFLKDIFLYENRDQHSERNKLKPCFLIPKRTIPIKLCHYKILVKTFIFSYHTDVFDEA